MSIKGVLNASSFSILLTGCVPVISNDFPQNPNYSLLNLLIPKCSSKKPSGFKQPTSSGFNQPTSSGFNQPTSSGFNQPTSSGFNQPTSSGFNQPSSAAVPAPMIPAATKIRPMKSRSSVLYTSRKEEFPPMCRCRNSQRPDAKLFNDGNRNTEILPVRFKIQKFLFDPSKVRMQDDKWDPQMVTKATSPRMFYLNQWFMDVETDGKRCGPP
ncbi:unnamed protein product [Caenorhabditis nigoni]